MRTVQSVHPDNADDARWAKRLSHHDDRKRGRHDGTAATRTRRRRLRRLEDLSTPSKSVQSFDDGGADGYFPDIMSIIQQEFSTELRVGQTTERTYAHVCQCALVSRQQRLGESVQALQRQAEDISACRDAEDREIRDETTHLTKEVIRIQSTIAQFMDAYQEDTEAPMM